MQPPGVHRCDTCFGSKAKSLHVQPKGHHMHASSTERKKARAAEGRGRAGNANEGNQVHQNIGDTERMVSGILGGTMLISGLTRRTLPGLALAAAGAAFLYRAGSGHCMVYEYNGI